VLYVQHLLEVNDVVIAARLFPRYERRVAISEVRYENHFKQHPIYVDKNMFLCPDGYVHFILSPPYDEPGTSLGVILEIDRGSEDVNTIIRNKIKNYRRFFSSGFDQVFDIESFVVAFVVTSGGSARVKQLVSCTEKELVGTPGVGDFFIFTSVDSSRIDPLPFFTSPVWLQPFRASPVPLI